MTVRKTEAPFAALFQKVAPTLAAKSQEYNLIVSDSQWLGALSEPGWIVKADDVYALNPELDIKPYSSLVRKTYQIYPDGSGQRWGFPQMPDTQGLFMRQDMLEDPAEQAAWKAKNGKKLPTTYEEFETMTIQDYEKLSSSSSPAQTKSSTALLPSTARNTTSSPVPTIPTSMPRAATSGIRKTGNVVGVLNTDANAKQTRILRSLQKYHAARRAQTLASHQMIDLFTQGKVFSAFQWHAVGLSMIPAGAEGKVMAVPHPKFVFPDGETKDVIGAMGGQPWVINTYNDDDHMRASHRLPQMVVHGRGPERIRRQERWPALVREGRQAEGFEELKPYTRAFKYMLQ